MNSLLLFQAQLFADWLDVNEERDIVRNNLQVLYFCQSNKDDEGSNTRVIIGI